MLLEGKDIVITACASTTRVQTCCTVQPDILAGIIFGGLIAGKRKKIAIGGYKFGDYGTIATPSPGVGAILADLILAV